MVVTFISDKHQSLDSSNVRDYFAEKLKTNNAMTWVSLLIFFREMLGVRNSLLVSVLNPNSS